LSRLIDKEIPLERWYVGPAEQDDFTIRALVAFIRAHLDD
jgi:hypothetical protein